MAQFFSDDITDVMTRVLVKRNAVWANKRASQDTTSTMFRHHEGTRCICEPCSDARPQPSRKRGLRLPLIYDPLPSTDGVGRPSVPRVPAYGNRPVQTVDIDADRLPFVLRLLNGPNRTPAPVPKYAGSTLFKKGHF